MKHRIFIVSMVLIALCTTSCTKRALLEANELYNLKEPVFFSPEYGDIMLEGSIGYDSNGNLVFQELLSKEKLVLTGNDLDFIAEQYESYLVLRKVERCCFTLQICGRYCPNKFLQSGRGLKSFCVTYSSLLW